MSQFALAYEDESLRDKAEALASDLNLPLNQQASSRLLLTSDYLALQMGAFAPVFADFNCKTWQKRHDAGKKQGLIRACKPGKGIKIIDATAGWGRDAAVLASFGADVLMLERHPVLAVLLEDGLRRQDEHSQSILKLRLKKTDAMEYLKTLPEEDWPEVIYIDPMHPQRQKTALVKKELQLLQQFIKPDSDVRELILLAQTRVLKKVVVKWPQSAAPLLVPHQSVQGKTVRFDVYLPAVV